MKEGIAERMHANANTYRLPVGSWNLSECRSSYLCVSTATHTYRRTPPVVSDLTAKLREEETYCTETDHWPRLTRLAGAFPYVISRAAISCGGIQADI